MCDAIKRPCVHVQNGIGRLSLEPSFCWKSHNQQTGVPTFSTKQKRHNPQPTSVPPSTKNVATEQPQQQNLQNQSLKKPKAPCSVEYENLSPGRRSGECSARRRKTRATTNNRRLQEFATTCFLFLARKLQLEKLASYDDPRQRTDNRTITTKTSTDTVSLSVCSSMHVTASVSVSVSVNVNVSVSVSVCQH